MYVCVHVDVHVYMHVTKKYQFYLQNTRNYSIYFFLLVSNSYV